MISTPDALYRFNLRSSRLSLIQTLDKGRYLTAMRRSHLTLRPEIYGHLPSLDVHDEQILIDLENSDQVLVGGLSLRLLDQKLRHWEIGYWIVPEASGQGYISEAARVLLRELFTHHRSRKVEIQCDARNHGSMEIARRLGFNAEAIWSGMDPVNGKVVKRLSYALYELEDLKAKGEVAAPLWT